MLTKILKASFIAIFILLNYSSFAQNENENIDQKTLELFQNKQYKRLIFVGEEAIKNGTDYFYLRLRIGIAYYEAKNYRMAAHHFEKALFYNSDDEVDLEYLYYSYLFAGRSSDANFLTLRMTDELKEKIGYKSKILSSVYAEGGTSISNNFSKNSGIDIDADTNIYGENDLNNNVMYAHIGLKHDILPFLSIYQGFSHIGLDKRKIIRMNNKDSINNSTLLQNDYYINSEIQIKNSIKLTPAFHFIRVQANSLAYQYDTAKYIGSFSETTLNLNNYVLFLGVSKDYKKTTLSLSLSYSNLNYAKQIQFGLGFTYYPFGNLNLYTNTNLFLFNQKVSASQGSSKDNRIIFDQMFGLKIFPKLWTEAGITIGNLTNYNEKNAFIVYNVADKINMKAGISFIYSLSSKFELSLRYQLIKRENSYITYENYTTIISNTINYQNNTIIGGIKWKL
jgi:hypothetical protein